MLGVGAQIDFVTNGCGSRWIVYIASRQIEDFLTIESIEQKKREEEYSNVADPIDLNKYVNPVVQMLSLYTIMEMGDHHQGNFGVNKAGLPFIIDFFFVPNYSFDVKTSFYNRILCRHKETLKIK